ncbi:hypothetical protein J3R74_003813 [Puniceicoccus vermicola]
MFDRGWDDFCQRVNRIAEILLYHYTLMESKEDRASRNGFRSSAFVGVPDLSGIMLPLGGPQTDPTHSG